MPFAAAHQIDPWNQEEVIMKIDRDKVFAVIMAGGKGERLWPLSTEERPKPLISLNGQQTLLEDTVQRLFPLLNAENVFVFPNNKNIILAAEQVDELTEKNVIVIPTRSVPQGVSAVLTFDESAEVDEIKDTMMEAVIWLKQVLLPLRRVIPSSARRRSRKARSSV